MNLAPKRLLIFGCGGHGREIAWVAERQFGNSVAIEFVVDQAVYRCGSVNGRHVHLFEDLMPDDATQFVAALGDPHHRRKAEELMSQKFKPTSILDPSLICSQDVTFGSGSVVMPGCIITTNVSIGEHAHLNVGCRVSHDVQIDQFATLCPGVHIAGYVIIRENAFLGTNVTIINGAAGKPLVIGKNAVVAAGACVIGNVPENSMVAGVPAVVKKYELYDSRKN